MGGWRNAGGEKREKNRQKRISQTGFYRNTQLNFLINRQFSENSQTPVALSRLPQGPTYSHCMYVCMYVICKDHTLKLLFLQGLLEMSTYLHQDRKAGLEI